MKRLLIIVFIAFILPGCKKENPYISLIVGRWSTVRSSTDIYKNNILVLTDTNPYDARNFIEFFKDGRCHEEFYLSPSIPSPYRFDGTYSIQGDSIKFESNPVKGKINTLTANSLSYTFYYYISPVEYRISQADLKK